MRAVARLARAVHMRALLASNPLRDVLLASNLLIDVLMQQGGFSACAPPTRATTRLMANALRFQPPPGEASGLPPSGEAGLCLCSRLSSATICCHFGTLGFVRITLSLIADL